MPKKGQNELLPAEKAEKNSGEKAGLKEQLKEIRAILAWFDEQEELDVEAALAKIKKAGAIIKASKKRLTEVENEFREIQEE